MSSHDRVRSEHPPLPSCSEDKQLLQLDVLLHAASTEATSIQREKDMPPGGVVSVSHGGGPLAAHLLSLGGTGMVAICSLSIEERSCVCV